MRVVKLSMTTTDDRDPMREASDRRLASTPIFVPNPRPARRDIIRTHRVPKRKVIR
jgi:hypothetical protein